MQSLGLVVAYTPPTIVTISLETFFTISHPICAVTPNSLDKTVKPTKHGLYSFIL